MYEWSGVRVWCALNPMIVGANGRYTRYAVHEGHEWILEQHVAAFAAWDTAFGSVCLWQTLS